ncbi:thiol reductant ABC exporter subunit CydD [Salisediminibacterium beveridgei]|uniref:Transport ATP-binding protein CydD n=1 Tax=Salisediminibacterium beveridgei TaxID=632773 RepID=A0A1D7QYB2_9BACI|nr:thiol reductant ABC exporter subunit CydD [Salisediminibacterium beveridgei]AOM83989.1 Transport ATP-binding protein CydD [Salisediminibacterium beveridgei]
MLTLKDWAKRNRKITGLLRLNALGLGLSIVLMAYGIVAVVDGVFLQERSFTDVLPLIGLTAFALVMRSLFVYVNGSLGAKLGASLKREYRHTLAEHFSMKETRPANDTLSGERTGIFVDSVDEAEGYVSKYYPQLILSSTVPLVLLAAIFYMNWVSGLILLITAPFIPIMMIVVGKNAEKKSEAQMEKLNRFSGTFLDLLQGLVTLRFLGKTKEKADAIRQSSTGYRDATMDVLKVAFLSSLMLEFISMLSIALVALEVGLRLVIFDQLTFFTAFFVLILAPEFFASLKELGTAFHNGKSSTGSWERIRSILEEDSHEPVWGEKRLAEGPVHLEIREVQFTYGTDQFALGPLDFNMEPGSHTAVVGASGAGKSTLLQLMSGLVSPQKGEMLVNATPLKELKQEEWLDAVSYITQSPYLFSGTVRDNICLGSVNEATETEVYSAVKETGLQELVERLPDGLDTPIGEGGRGLSGGERQRIALARAFIKKPDVIVFDEPTTGLDLRTEQLLQEGISRLAKGATMITVAHRLHTIQSADQILYLEDGKLSGIGTHRELLERIPTYRDMVTVNTGGEAQ